MEGLIPVSKVPIREVLSVVAGREESLSILSDKWTDFARELDTPSSEIKTLRNELLLNKLTLSDVVTQIIESWSVKKTAKIEALAKAFTTVGLKSLAEELSSFAAPLPASAVSETNKTEDTKPTIANVHLNFDVVENQVDFYGFVLTLATFIINVLTDLKYVANFDPVLSFRLHFSIPLVFLTIMVMPLLTCVQLIKAMETIINRMEHRRGEFGRELSIRTGAKMTEFLKLENKTENLDLVTNGLVLFMEAVIKSSCLLFWVLFFEEYQTVDSLSTMMYLSSSCWGYLRINMFLLKQIHLDSLSVFQSVMTLASHTCIIGARISAMAAFSEGFAHCIYFCLIHWLIMIIWKVLEGENIKNSLNNLTTPKYLVSLLINSFTHINFRKDKSKDYLFKYYTLIFIENSLCVAKLLHLETYDGDVFTLKTHFIICLNYFLFFVGLLLKLIQSKLDFSTIIKPRK